jgi:HK97 family phage major capsid protein
VPTPLEELRASVAELRGEIVRLSDIEDISEEDDEKLTVMMSEYEIRKADLDRLEERARRIEEMKALTTQTVVGYDPNFGVTREVDPFEGDVMTLPRPELRDRALKVVETEGRSLSAAQQDKLDSLLRNRLPDRDNAIIAQRMLLTEHPAYRSAFMKGVTGRPNFSAEESQALSAFDEFRAASEGTMAAGGFGVPVLIDPTIILTSGAADAPILNIARTVNITTNQWKGVTSAGVVWSFDAEGTEVSDDTPTLAQPTVPVYMARGFVPYSIEVGMDYPGFAEEMSMLLNQGYLNLVAIKSMSGTGTLEPNGIFTAMQNATTSPAHVLVTTKGALGAIDVRKAWSALPERFRPNATWLMSVDVENQVRAFGNALALSDYTVNLAADGTSVLTGRPVVTTDYAPSFVGTTGAESFAVVGDFRNYLIVQRAGMAVELVQHLLGTTSGRPTGQRGWFAWARLGFDAVNTNGFRLIANT